MNTSTSSNELGSPLDMSLSEECADLLVDDVTAPPTSDISSPYIAARQAKRKKKPLTETPFQSKILKLLDTDETLDSDATILMSFLPKFKMLTEDQKTDFQIYALQFFKNLSRPNHPSMYNYLQPPNSFLENPMMYQNMHPIQPLQLTQLHSPSTFNQPQTYTSIVQNRVAQQQAYDPELSSAQETFSEYSN